MGAQRQRRRQLHQTGPLLYREREKDRKKKRNIVRGVSVSSHNIRHSIQGWYALHIFANAYSIYRNGQTFAGVSRWHLRGKALRNRTHSYRALQYIYGPMSGSLVDGKWNQQRKKNAIKMMYFGLEFMECEGKKRILRISALLSDLIAFFEPGIRAGTLFFWQCLAPTHMWRVNTYLGFKFITYKWFIFG